MKRSTAKNPIDHLPIRERDLQAGICELLGWCKIDYTVTDASRTWGMNGEPRKSKFSVTKDWPDVTGCMPDGRFLAIETKTKGGRLTVGQSVLLARMRKAGAVVIVPRSIEDAARALKASGVVSQFIEKLLK